ncbi:MAG: class I SAM-dependent methyltransferase family protein [Candidatus Bathyarchaeia archaeon]
MRKRLRRTLAEVLPAEEAHKVYNSFDIIGDIAIIKLPVNASEKAQVVAKTIMSIHRNVKTVLLQTGPVAGDFRLRDLKHVAGENKTSTIHREFGGLFAVDVAKAYFSPRLAYERMRIAQLVEPNETVVNMFAGVGCFSIIIAKYSQVSKVFSIDVNAAAFQFMQENIRLNRVYDKVIPLLGDSKEIVTSQLQHTADRVLMPLPEKALDYLPCAVSALKDTGGWIHYYGLEHATKTERPTEKVKFKITEKLEALGVNFEVPFVRVVRSTGPNWFQLAADIHIT